MFEDRHHSIFPHPASAWWIPILLAVGWIPLYIADFLTKPGDWATGENFGMAWGMGIALPFSALAVLSVLVQAFRFLMYFLNRPKPL
jgi:hypothetical protein